jgi:hypothetical protein
MQLSPAPQLPEATIETIQESRVYLVVNNGRIATAKFQVFTEAHLRVFPSRIPIPVGIKPRLRTAA